MQHEYLFTTLAVCEAKAIEKIAEFQGLYPGQEFVLECRPYPHTAGV